jgi:hypothetical protein
MVRAQAEEAGDDLGPEPRRWTEPCGRGGVVEQGRVVAQIEDPHETGVELGHRHRRGRVGRRPRRPLRERGDEVAELALRERVVGPERADASGHQAASDHDLDLGLSPGAGRLGRRRRRRGRETRRQACEHGNQAQSSHAPDIVCSVEEL